MKKISKLAIIVSAIQKCHNHTLSLGLKDFSLPSGLWQAQTCWAEVRLCLIFTSYTFLLINEIQVAPSHAQAEGGRRLYPEAVDMEGQVYVDGLKQLSPALTSNSSINRYERTLLGGRSG